VRYQQGDAGRSGQRDARTRGVSNRCRCTGEAAKTIAIRGGRQPPSLANLVVPATLDLTHHADPAVPVGHTPRVLMQGRKKTDSY
jgi:hypothetical protein